MNTRICSKCKKEKSLLENYLRASNIKNGFRPECKECQKAYRKQKDVAERLKRYVKENKDKLKSYAKAYRENTTCSA